MKKQVIFSLSLLASVLATASTVSSDNTFGILKITATSPETVIGVPWVAVGDGTGDIKISDLILTSNLKAGDYLYYYDSSACEYKAWYLTEDATAWTAISAVSTLGGSDVKIPDSASLFGISRGSALILKLSNWGSRESANKDIYIYGQYAELSASVTTGITRASDKVVWNLIAPPSTGEFNLNTSAQTEGTPNKNDSIIVGFDKVLVYRNTGTTESPSWKWATQTWDDENNKWTYDSSAATIPAGTGAWYKAAKSEGNSVTIKWAPAS